MRLSGRLDRLERKWPGGCPECGGNQPVKVVTRDPGAPIPDPKPCGTCGKFGTQLVVTYDITATPVDYREAIRPLLPLDYELHGAEQYSGSPPSEIIRSE